MLEHADPPTAIGACVADIVSDLAKTPYAHLDRQAFAQVAREFGLLCDTVMLTPETP